MGNETSGQFFVGRLEDGRFAALAATAPFFCFRADSEEAVLDKVRAAVEFCQGRVQKDFAMEIKPRPAQTVTTVQPSRRLSIHDLEMAA